MNAREMSQLVKAVEETAEALTPKIEGYPDCTEILWTLVEAAFVVGQMHGLDRVRANLDTHAAIKKAATP